MTKGRMILLVVLIAAGIGAVLVWSTRSKPVAVQVATVESGEVQRTVTNTRAGTLNACRRARLSPSMGGQIARLPVREGEQVTEGQVLFEIWNQDLQAQLSLSRSELIASRALREQACVQADLAQSEAVRTQALQAQGLSTRETLEKANSLALSSQAACEAASANVLVSEARIAVAQAAIERTRLLAPFDGTIAEVNGELGEYVTPSPVGIQTLPAVDIIDVSCLYIGAPIDEVDAAQIRPDMVARISLDAFRGQLFEGRVRRIAPYVLDLEKQARTVDIEVDFSAASETAGMLPGYTADVEVVLDSSNSNLRIPSEALLEGGRVFVYDPDFETLSSVTVKTGLSNWQYTEIIEGLESGDQVVTSVERDGVVDGASVTIE